MEEQTKGITEKYNAKCVDYDCLETELSQVKEALKDALDTINIQDTVRKEAKESQVKCYVLEEQIEVSVLRVLRKNQDPWLGESRSLAHNLHPSTKRKHFRVFFFTFVT